MASFSVFFFSYEQTNRASFRRLDGQKNADVDYTECLFGGEQEEVCILTTLCAHGKFLHPRAEIAKRPVLLPPDNTEGQKRD